MPTTCSLCRRHLRRILLDHRLTNTICPSYCDCRTNYGFVKTIQSTGPILKTPPLWPGDSRRTQRRLGSAELYSAVSQICNLRTVAQANALPNTIWRYSRFKICATRRGVGYAAAGKYPGYSIDGNALKRLSSALARIHQASPRC